MALLQARHYFSAPNLKENHDIAFCFTQIKNSEVHTKGSTRTGLLLDF